MRPNGRNRVLKIGLSFGKVVRKSRDENRERGVTLRSFRADFLPPDAVLCHWWVILRVCDGRAALASAYHLPNAFS